MTVSVIEIDIPFCVLRYGESTARGTCPAVLGVDSAIKCFNTIRTCAVRASFNAEALTLRFCMPAGDIGFERNELPVVVIPSIKSISVTPAIVNPGVDVGTRETVRVVFDEHPHSDAQVDKYLTDRSYDPYGQGTFWAKLRARNPSLEGYALRLLIGNEGQDLADMTTYHYVVDSLTGLSEQVTLVAKDMLILADKKKAQAPRISNGVLDSDITAGAGSLTLSPGGIGDAEYPAAGKIAIGGKEVCQFTRVADTVTLVTRGDSGTDADEHDEGDIVQLVLIYSAAEPADIIEDLLVTYTPGIDAAWIDTAEWQVEVDEYIGRLYSAEIAEPTSVVDLLNELIEQVGLVFWWDPVDVMLRLTSLRPVSAEAKLYTDDHFLATSFKATEQANKRISEVWTYYGMRNPLESIDESNNFKAAIATIDPEAEMDYEQPAIKKVFSRWIAADNRPAASRLNSMLLSRYRDAPRKLTFALYETIDQAPTLGVGFRASTWSLQDSTGAPLAVPAQVTSIERREDRYIVDAQEAIFATQDDLETVRLLFIDDDTVDVNLRTFHDQLYSEPQTGDTVRCIISSGVYVGSSSTSTPALDVGSWPASVTIELVINGFISGRGGQSASVGGTALYTRYAIDVTNNSRIAGGGGGGGRGKGINIGTVGDPSFYFSKGGGGAGYQPGSGSSGSSAGTKEAGGAGISVIGSTSGAGGGPGLQGLAGNHPSSGGNPGTAVDGESFITYSVEGSIIGARVN